MVASPLWRPGRPAGAPPRRPERTGGGRTAPMTILALETGTRTGSIALLRGGDLLAATEGDPTRTHGERLPDDVLRLLAAHGVAPAGVDLLAVSCGAGLVHERAGRRRHRAGTGARSPPARGRDLDAGGWWPAALAEATAGTDLLGRLVGRRAGRGLRRARGPRRVARGPPGGRPSRAGAGRLGRAPRRPHRRLRRGRRRRFPRAAGSAPRTAGNPRGPAASAGRDPWRGSPPSAPAAARR